MTLNVGIDIAKQAHFRVGLSDVVGRTAGLAARTAGAIGRTTYA